MNLNLIAIGMRLFSGGTNDKWVLNLQKVTNCFNLQYFHISSNGCNSRLLLISKQWDKYIMWSDTCLMPKLDDVLETWKPMDAITLTNALISIHYWDVNWSFESGLLKYQDLSFVSSSIHHTNGEKMSEYM